MSAGAVIKAVSVFGAGYALFRYLESRQGGGAADTVAIAPTIAPPISPATQTIAKAEPMSANVYKSAAEDAAVHPSGLIRLATKAGPLEVTRLPLIDQKSGLFARLDTPSALEALGRLGMRLLTADEWQAIVLLAQQGSPDVFAVEPCTLVHSVNDQRYMRSLAFQQKHDDCVFARLKGWNGKSFVLNVGKQWLLPRGGKATNFGWWPIVAGLPRTKPIQGAGNAHELTYTDYSQLTVGVRV